MFKRFLSRLGEPIQSGFDPAQWDTLLNSMGYELIDNLSPEELKQRYFQRRDD